MVLLIPALAKGAKVLAGSKIAKSSFDESGQFLTEKFGYDFVALITKLTVYFVIALIFAKLMEAIIFTRGSFVLIANLLGFNIPKSEQLPDSLKKLFNGGISGLKFWDFVKIVAILLVIAEFIRYTKLPQKSSPLTIGIFILIIAVLGITTVPELAKRLKNTDFNLESLK